MEQLEPGLPVVAALTQVQEELYLHTTLPARREAGLHRRQGRRHGLSGSSEWGREAACEESYAGLLVMRVIADEVRRGTDQRRRCPAFVSRDTWSATPSL